MSGFPEKRVGLCKPRCCEGSTPRLPFSSKPVGYELLAHPIVPLRFAEPLLILQRELGTIDGQGQLV